MSNPFFEHPILNSPYTSPQRHWELDAQGQPTQQIMEQRRRADFITPIPKPRKRKKAAAQKEMVFDEGKGLSTEEQQYDPTSIINELRQHVDQWRSLPNPNQWGVTPETSRLLQHWRHHDFSNIRPFFCQIEAAETVIWLTEVAPQSKPGKAFLEHLASASSDANPELTRLALKMATGAGRPLGDGGRSGAGAAYFAITRVQAMPLSSRITARVAAQTAQPLTVTRFLRLTTRLCAWGRRVSTVAVLGQRGLP